MEMKLGSLFVSTLCHAVKRWNSDEKLWHFIKYIRWQVWIQSLVYINLLLLVIEHAKKQINFHIYGIDTSPIWEEINKRWEEDPWLNRGHHSVATWETAAVTERWRAAWAGKRHCRRWIQGLAACEPVADLQRGSTWEEGSTWGRRCLHQKWV
jgi:hypothetical protein